MKNKIIIFIGLLGTLDTSVAVPDYLDIKIAELEQRRDQLKTELAACEKNTKGYKIAGIATLGTTGIGIYGNIKLAQEIKKIETSKSGGGVGGGVGGKVQEDNRSEEQKISAECKMFCADMPEDAVAMGCEC